MEFLAVTLVIFLLIFMAFVDFAAEIEEEKPACKVHKWVTTQDGKLSCAICDTKPHLTLMQDSEDGK